MLQLPTSILEFEENTSYFNLAVAALLRSGIVSDVGLLQAYSPIYKPVSSL
jgi:inorganic pyrophosphatase/exopolyphosphatase